MENSRRFDICIIIVHRASYVKHLRSQKHLEKEKESELIIPKWLFQDPIGKKIQKLFNPKTLKQIARNNIRLHDKQLNKEIAKSMKYSYCFTDKALQVGSIISLLSDIVNHSISKLTNKPNFPKFGIEPRYVTKILEVMARISALLMNQNKFKNHTKYSAKFDKQNEDNQLLDETQLYISLNINHNVTETDLEKIDVRFVLNEQNQKQEIRKIWVGDLIKLSL